MQRKASKFIGTVLRETCHLTTSNTHQHESEESLSAESGNASNTAVTSKYSSEISIKMTAASATKTRYITAVQVNQNLRQRVQKKESVYSKNKDVFSSQPLNKKESEILIRSIQTSIPSAVANTVSQVSNLNYSVKQLICKDINDSCQALCHKTDGSLLFNTGYESMAKINSDMLWTELKNTIPFFIDILNSVSGKAHSIEDTPHDLKVQYGFIYSILMKTRWHALSLFQRINTVLMIDGGVSRKVYFLSKFRQNCNSSSAYTLFL